MTARPSAGVECDLLALYLSGWSYGPLDQVYHQDVEDTIARARQTFARRVMSVEDSLRWHFDERAAAQGVDRHVLEIARGHFSRYRMDLLPNDPDHPQAFSGLVDQLFGIPYTNDDLEMVFRGDLPDGS